MSDRVACGVFGREFWGFSLYVCVYARTLKVTPQYATRHRDRNVTVGYGQHCCRMSGSSA